MEEGSARIDSAHAIAHGIIWPGVRAARAAMRELTFLGGSQPVATMGLSALFYPVVGLLLGGGWLGADVVAGLVVGRFWASAFVLAVALLLTRARTLMGAARTLVAMLARGRARPLSKMDGPLTWPVSVSAIVFLAVELVCLSHVERLRPLALVSAPLLGRWSMVVLGLGSRAARADGRRVKFAPGVTFREFGWASTVTFALLFSVSGFLGVILALAAALVTVGFRLVLHRRFDGITPASLGAVCEITQLVPLAILALL